MTLFKILNTPSLFFQSELFREGRFALRRDLRRSVDEKDGNRPWTFSDLLRFLKEGEGGGGGGKTTNVNGEQEKGV